MSCCNDDTKARLNRIEGQIRGIKDMVEKGRKCEEIIIQLSAVNSAITAAAKEILNQHIKHCVVEAIKQGDEKQIIDDLLVAIDKFSKLK